MSHIEKSDSRLILVRHGQPRQHSGRIFLGQTDVPLSERGREEAAAAGEEVARLGARAARVYSSDLLRARETAVIVAARLGGAPVVLDAHFRELDMGAWDGELVADIQRRYPDEYARRGEDMLNYRVPGGESFQDLRKRVMAGWHRLMREDFPAEPGKGADLVLVTHLGVIHTLLAELTRESREAIWSRRHPTGSVLLWGFPHHLSSSMASTSATRPLASSSEM